MWQLLRSLMGFVPGQAKRIIAHTRLFFVVGMGRSGSMWLSRVLNKVPHCAVYHEVRADRYALLQAYWHPERAQRYWAWYRDAIVAARVLRADCQVYGEVNSLLRHHVDALNARWHPTFLHLVRDGRDVVRSIMNRTSFTKADRWHTGRLRPLDDDPILAQWDNMDRFGRVCWYWASANRELLQRDLILVRFDDIIQSYDSFVAQVLEPLSLDLPFEVWQADIANPRNVSQYTAFPAWEDWSTQQKQQFGAICGDLMRALGYQL